VERGASSLDIGGSSTKPGSKPPSSLEEWQRVFPLLKMVKQHFPSLLISLDTFCPSVARKACENGLVDILNDIYAGRIIENNENMFSIAKEFQKTLILMHMKGEPSSMQEKPFYENCIEEVFLFLKERLEEAQKYDVPHIIIDPGIGFGKRLEDNLALLSPQAFQKLKELEKPILIGLSRKRFMMECFPLQNLKNPLQRDCLSKVYEWHCVAHGTTWIRTHEL